MPQAGDRLHLLGICGTFMGGLAVLARALGWRVTGSDRNVYPPMSTMLEARGIEITEGFDASQLTPPPALTIVGNAMTRGIPAVEHLLSAQLPYASGPQWLGEHVLRERHVLAVAGTHGKTTTASMLALILDRAGLAPGFLIGGVPADFGVSARLGASRWFVIEADEYDTAFFDKRSKFLHYHPRTLVLNNLEFDHADIFPDLAAIERQFHHVVRIVPREGRVIVNAASDALARVLAQGCWSEVAAFGWHDDTVGPADGRGGGAAQAHPAPARDDAGDAERAAPLWTLREVNGSDRYEVLHGGAPVAVLPESVRGRHNAENALAAVAAAQHAGVAPAEAIAALAGFRGVARRLEMVIACEDVVVYDDFAHHPTAIARTLEAVRATMRRPWNGAGPQRRLLAVLEPRSNTMRLGVHGASLARALALADECWLHAPADVRWDPRAVLGRDVEALRVFERVDELSAALGSAVQPGDVVVLMSNGAFGGLRDRLAAAIRERFG